MHKIDSEFIIKQYQSGLENYVKLTKEVGLWQSEKYLFQKYLSTSDRILDLGCGAGRTTFALYKLGYQNIIGIDLTPEMIQSANLLNDEFGFNIPFGVGDATDLKLESSAYDAVLFSFNGLMSIPRQENRDRALAEIRKALKSNGVFLFTTHDRNREKQYIQFWKDEKIRWQEGIQNSKLHEFGDVIAPSKNEREKIFIHIPDEQEVIDWLTNSNFIIIESFDRSDRFEESEQVKESSGSCRFWAARKNA